MTRLLLGASALALTTGAAAAQEQSFNRIASFPVTQNLPDGTDPATETSPEIVAATADGMTLVYTDSPLGAVGFVDLTDPAAPAPLGVMMLDGGEPTSVAIAGGIALVGVNTSESFTDPSGHLLAVTIDGMEEVARCDLPGQPDSNAVALDGSFLAVAIENERDEDLGAGRVGQLPGGAVWMVDLTAEGTPDCATARTADITGLAEIAPEDPEPEYVHINAEGEVVVTLQENNHIVVLSSAGEVLSHFSAGAVTLEDVDTAEERALTFDDTLQDVPREPDAVAWIDADHFATANEGDMDGGSRGFTIFHQDGEVIYESGLSFEYAVAEIGHYPERRSGNKGVEPESVTFAEYGGTPMLFVGSERGSVVGVYDVTDPSAPVLTQLLPSGVGPEGYATIPARGLLVSANEADLIEDGAARAHLMVFERQDAAPVYPHLTSAGATLENGAPIGWGALSGLTAADGMLYAVNDSFYAAQPSIFEIDVSEAPARITRAIRVTRNGDPAQLLDMEGIAADGEGGFWIASEGRADRLIPHALYHVDAAGEIQDYVPLPPELLAVERRFGMEGVTLVDGTLYAILQREWQDDAEDTVKLLAYDLEAEDWSAAAYPKAAPEGPGWIGLSEVVHHDGHLYFIERDNQIGEAARVKKITRVAMGFETAPLGGDLPMLEVEDVRDIVPDLLGTGGYVVDKPEGLTFLNGEMWLVTDNDGVDDSSGETLLLNLGTPE